MSSTDWWEDPLVLWDDVYLSAVTAELGGAERVADAVADGRYEPEECAADDYVSISVVDDARSPVDLAVAAATAALDRAGLGSVGLLLHAGIGHQGMDHFTAASYIQGKVAGGLGPALEVRQSSNGGMAALELAAAYLTAVPAASSALVTSADKFVPPMYDRYRLDQGMVMADGGTAVVLSRTGGVARLLSTVVIGDPMHGEVYVGTDAWTDSGGGFPIDLRNRKRQHLANGGDIWEIIEHVTGRQLEVLTAALAEAGTAVEDVARFVFPNHGRTLQDWEGRLAHGIDEPRTTWRWGRTVGHLGAGDQAAGLAHLLESGESRQGDRVVLCGLGSGWTYSAAVLEITADVSWSPVSGRPHPERNARHGHAGTRPHADRGHHLGVPERPAPSGPAHSAG